MRGVERGLVMDINAGTIKYGYIDYLFLSMFLRATQWYINGYTVCAFPSRVANLFGGGGAEGTDVTHRTRDQANFR